MKSFLKFGILSRMFSNFGLYLALLKDLRSRRYRKIPYLSTAAILFTILYIFSPFDILPDYLLGLGQLDDALVFGICLFVLEKDLKDYREWRVRNVP
jgi:uncharacterized membrane protein YkvA (DUF1232 family)